MINATENEKMRIKDLTMKSFQTSVQGIDDRGVNAMSISEITSIPRPTVVRKLKYLIKNNYLTINEKKLVSVDIKGNTLKRSRDLQDKNIQDLSNFIYRVFNQIIIRQASKSLSGSSCFPSIDFPIHDSEKASELFFSKATSLDAPRIQRKTKTSKGKHIV